MKKERKNRMDRKRREGEKKGGKGRGEEGKKLAYTTNPFKNFCTSVCYIFSVHCLKFLGYSEEG
jgi:hypothetical protein